MASGENISKWLMETTHGKVRFNEPMSKHTSFKIGGPAEAYVEPRSIEELKLLLAGIRERGLECTVIGRGTNLLVRDNGIKGVVIALVKGINKFSIEEENEDQTMLKVMAGANLQATCKFAAKKGLEGMNFGFGIPGTVGGSVAMNAGTSLGETKDYLHSVRIIDDKGQEQVLDAAEIDFSYRNLNWGKEKKDCSPIIIEAGFLLINGDPDKLWKEAWELLRYRKEKQPVALPSAGCFFKNPEPGVSAGELIDRAGLKGKMAGGAMISDKHANFIINAGKAVALDVLELMKIAQERVYELFDVSLSPEVKIVGY